MKAIVYACAAMAVISVGAWLILGEVGHSSAERGSSAPNVRLE